MILEEFTKKPKDKKLEIERIIEFKQDFIELFVLYLKKNDFSYYDALLGICEFYDLSLSDIKIIVNNHLSPGMLKEIEKEARNKQMIKENNEIVEEEIIICKIKEDNDGK